jgi:membrane fusion protein (multidrug efflux system)
VRTALDLRERFAGKGGFGAVVVKLRLPDGREYGQKGKLDFVDNSVTGNTDSITLRGVIPNPPLPAADGGDGTLRELVDNELVTVILEDAQPVEALTIPRSAVLSDQTGDYVYIVDGAGKAERRPIVLGQSTPTTANVAKGLAAGDKVVVEGIQRVRPGQPVVAGPASPSPAQ